MRYSWIKRRQVELTRCWYPSWPKRWAEICASVSPGLRVTRERMSSAIVMATVYTRAVAEQSFIPDLRRQRQLVEFGAGFTPSRIVLFEDSDKAIVVSGLNKMDHLVNDHVLKKVLGFLHQLCV